MSCDVIHVMTQISISKCEYTHYDVRTNEFWKNNSNFKKMFSKNTLFIKIVMCVWIN
jgi:hypothetical protein